MHNPHSLLQILINQYNAHLNGDLNIQGILVDISTVHTQLQKYCNNKHLHYDALRGSPALILHL